MSDQILAAPAAGCALQLPKTIAEKFLNAESEVTSRFNTIISREQRYAASVAADRESGGWFGAFHRVVTTSDPFEVEISRARQVVHTAFFGLSLVQASKRETDIVGRVDKLNSARRLAGLREIHTGTLLPALQVPTSFGLNRVSTDGEHFELEQAAITVSRDVAITAAVAIGSFAGSAIAGAITKAGTTAASTSLLTNIGQEALMGGSIACSAATARAIDDVERRAKTPQQALIDVTRTTLWGAAFGGVFGGLLHGFRACMTHIRPGAAQRPQANGPGLPKPKSGLNDSPEPNPESPQRGK